MNKYSGITAEDRAIIVISINFRISGNNNGNDIALYSILYEMFKKNPSISFMDFPLLFSVVQDFYYALCSDEQKKYFDMVDKDILNELMSNCEALLLKMKEVSIENNLELCHPS